MQVINNNSSDGRTADDAIMTELFQDYEFPEPDCSKKLLMYVCTNTYRECHGLGDRERGIISSFMMSLLTNRTFVIKHTWPCSLSKFYKPNVYDWSKCLSASNSTNDQHILTYLDRKGNLPKFAELQKGDIWSERLVVVRTNFVVNDKINKHPSVNDTIPWVVKGGREYITRRLFNTLFKLEESLQQKIESFISNITLNGQRILVGVHIRQFYVKQSGTNRIFNAMENYSNKSKYSIYLSSDIDEVRLRGKRRFPNCFSLKFSGSVFHVDNKFADCETLEAAVFEQQVLARADIVIRTKSELSRLAYMIRPDHTLNHQYKYYEKRVIPKLKADLKP